MQLDLLLAVDIEFWIYTSEKNANETQKLKI